MQIYPLDCGPDDDPEIEFEVHNASGITCTPVRAPVLQFGRNAGKAKAIQADLRVCWSSGDYELRHLCRSGFILDEPPAKGLRAAPIRKEAPDVIACQPLA